MTVAVGAHPIRVGRSLDDESFQEIRGKMELSHFKWDVQIGDVTGLAPFPLLVTEATWRELADLAQRLAAETLAVESELLERPDLHRKLALPRALRALFARRRERRGSNASAVPTPAAARVMRFDFHYTTDGWRISEVNSDVPGGYTEATSFTRLMAEQTAAARPAGDPTLALVDALVRKVGPGGAIALTCAPGHMEDHQVVGYLAARLRERGLAAPVVSPPHLRWTHGVASVESGSWSGRVDAVVRFYQVEWLAALPREVAWTHLFVGGITPVANPGTAALSESKRLPLIWDRLRTSLPTWRRLLPETRSLRAAPWASDDGWLIKSAFSNTGDSVSIRSAMTPAAWRRRSWTARLAPGQWIAQRRFDVAPVSCGGEPSSPCIGVYTVDGEAAGAYARIARRSAIIDGGARDAALLLSEDP
jgi:glutathionylspermidine synthase